MSAAICGAAAGIRSPGYRFAHPGYGSEPDRAAIHVVRIRALELHRGDLADAQRPPARHIDRAVDFRSVALASSLCDGRADLIDNHLLARADLGLQPLRRNRLLPLHEAMPALL